MGKTEKNPVVKKQTPTSGNPLKRLIDLIFYEIRDFETNGYQLTDKLFFNQYNTVQTIKTHQNKGFLTSLADGQTDDREFYDIISPMVETGVVNIDLDTENFEPYTVNEQHQAQQLVAKSLLNVFLKQSDESNNINSCEEAYIDDGNVVVRKIREWNKGSIYKQVQLQNLYVIDQTAETLEDSTVIEKAIFNQTQLRAMKDWKNVEKVIDLGNMGSSNKVPLYEIFYRYGEMSIKDFNFVQSQLGGKEIITAEGDNDEDDFIQALVIAARIKKDRRYNNVLMDGEGIVVFLEELVPEVIKVSPQLEIKKYKPYEEAHFGKYCGRWMRQGYRETGIPYENRANELGNQIREIMKLAGKIVFWSGDNQIAGKNILSSIKNGQIIQTTGLNILNNQFPNLSLFSEEWNRNIDECQKALKSAEVASGETLPSSTSATAVAIQNQQVGKYYDFKREKMGIFFANIYKRWVLPTLLEKTTMQDKLEISGDPTFLQTYAEGLATGMVIQNEVKMAALNGGTIDQDMFKQLVQIKTLDILKNKKHFLKLEKDFWKQVEIYIGINPTGELFNKQARVSNGLSLLQYLTNPVVMQDPNSRNIVIQIALSLGFRIQPDQAASQQIQQAQQAQPGQPGQSGQSMPMKEQSASAQAQQGQTPGQPGQASQPGQQ
jgi:hypothetical protein